jgi:hypothetical protein
MMKVAMVGACALACGLTLGASQAQAKFGVAKFNEGANGFTGAIPTSAPPIMVGSDGEVPFDPFGFGADTSDGIQLNGDWAPMPGFQHAFKVWKNIPGTSTWVVPACSGGVCENGAVVEPAAKWYFKPGSGWNPGTLSMAIFDVNGVLSDFVKVANDGPGGAATITFWSDSGAAGKVGPVPEPATWAMMLVGFGGLGALMRRSRKAAATA